jgi:serine/threonine protein kinase
MPTGERIAVKIINISYKGVEPQDLKKEVCPGLWPWRLLLIGNSQKSEERPVASMDRVLASQMVIHKSLDHQHIVHFYGFEQIDIFVYMFLEYASGGELFDAIGLFWLSGSRVDGIRNDIPGTGVCAFY